MRFVGCLFGFYAIVIAVLVTGISLGIDSWVIGVAGFVILFSSGMALAVREARPPERRRWRT